MVRRSVKLTAPKGASPERIAVLDTILDLCEKHPIFNLFVDVLLRLFGILIALAIASLAIASLAID